MRDAFGDVVLDRLQIVVDNRARHPIRLAFALILERAAGQTGGDAQRTTTEGSLGQRLLSLSAEKFVNVSCGFHSRARRTLHSFSKSAAGSPVPVFDELSVRGQVRARQVLALAVDVERQASTAASKRPS